VKALVFDGGRARVNEVRRPVARPGFVLVRVTASGICNTDLEHRQRSRFDAAPLVVNEVTVVGSRCG
jgi:threonine dehydrogenase-like Zn-dependent dehydrogenase